MESFFEQANGYGSRHGGLIGVLGLALGIIGIAYGFYSHNNPKKWKHRIYYKIFGLESPIPVRTIANRLRKNKNPFSSYIDLWNSGSEPIENSIVRHPLTISSQGGSQIESIQVDKESHPGLSNFRIESTESGSKISWDHFDPGMCVRIEIKSKKPIHQDDLIFFGSGYRMDISRLPTSMEIRTPFEVFIATGLVLFSMATLSFAVGSALTSDLLHNVSHKILYIAAIPSIVILFAGVIITVAGPILLMLAIKEIFTAKSPIEKELGSPPIEEIYSRDLRFEEMRYEHYRRIEAESKREVSARGASKSRVQPKADGT